MSNFKESEIKGVDSKGVVYLKMGVTRKKYNDKLDYDDMSHINDKLIMAEKINKFYQFTGTTPMTEDND